MKKPFIFFLATCTALALSACGTGKDPTALLVDTSATFTPSDMILPFVSGATQGAAYTSLTGYVGFSAVQGTTVINPLSGLVVENTGSSILIHHNQNFSVRLSGVTSIFRSGERLNTGDYVGVVNAGGGLAMYTYNSGSAICPMSLLTSVARQTLVTLFAGSPCTN